MKKILIVLLLSTLLVLSACNNGVVIPGGTGGSNVVKYLPRFNSCQELETGFKNARESGRSFGAFEKANAQIGGILAGDAESVAASPDYSETNIQVEGVDEADIVKTDGNYIYTLSGRNLVIARAYPADNAEILSITGLNDLQPNELFIDNDMLLVFGNKNINIESNIYSQGKAVIREYPNYVSVISADLYDISDRESPTLVRSIEFEGNYVTSRKIDDDVYAVINSYPRFYADDITTEEIVPKFRDMNEYEIKYSKETKSFENVAKCGDIGYLPPINPRMFTTVASISMSNENTPVNKEVVVGSGENVYASLNNLYIAETNNNYGIVREAVGRIAGGSNTQNTVVHKFALDEGRVLYQGNGEVPGRILNQFSMDEKDGFFRIATTISGYSNNQDTSTNNLYVLDDDLDIIGKLEGVAPGESIYSVRFIGDRGYMVTFRHIDPLFVIDLSDPRNPRVLGKLKIPGYSDYLHPYDETHLIGIGKEVDASIDADKVHTEGAIYYTAIQGVKLAIFDVSDVEHPIELHKEVIGDRGTESLATSDHKAFLFDRNKNLLVIPITVAELAEGQPKNMQGDFVFQGAYVYDISLNKGFSLRGKITHFDDDQEFKKSGYYFRGGKDEIRRSLYIDEILYTISQGRIQLNSLEDLETIKKLDIPVKEDYSGPIYY